MYYGRACFHRHMLACCVCAKAAAVRSDKMCETTPCTVERPLIDKDFSGRVAMTFAAAAMLTRRAKHWQDVIVAEGANWR